MHPALYTLMRLTWRGTWRRLFRGLRRPRGIFFFLIGAGFLLIGLLPVLLTGAARNPDGPATLRAGAPMAILALCLLNLLGSAGNKAIYFKPAEVDLLFPGPFTRRDLLVFKILSALTAMLFSAALFSVWLLPMSHFWLAMFLGVALALMFVQLFHMALSLIAATAGEHAYTRGRRIVLGVLFVAIALAVTQTFAGARVGIATNWARAFQESMLGGIILAPLRAFAETMAAETLYPGLIVWGSLALLVDIALAGVVVMLDTNFLEASTVASQKVYERVQRARRGGWGASSPVKDTTRRLPMFPRWAGAGLLAWRHLNAGARQLKTVAFRLMIFLAALVPVAFSRFGAEVPVWTPIAIMGWLSLFSAPQLLAFDFRSDLDQMDWLKTLPLRPTAVALGELFTPVLLLTVLHLLFLAVLACIYQRPADHVLIVAAAFFSPVMNLLVFAIENFIFLLFPVRMVPGAGGFQLMGRAIAVMFLKLAVIGVAFGLSAGAGGLAWFVAGKLKAIFWLVTWCGLVLCAAACVPVVAWAFNRFDPSSDMPD